MKVLITGGTGFIGSALSKQLCAAGMEVTVLSRTPAKVTAICGARVKALASLDNLLPDASFNVIVNLAGAGIFDAYWTADRKQLLRNSRIGLTEQLLAAIDRMTVKPELLISGSAIGYYGNQGDTELNERSEPIPDFSQQLCADWEAAALKAEQFGVRVCLIRTGLVVAGDGGILKRMLLPFKLGLGGRLGSGLQWMSWIQREDWIRITEAMIADTSMRGAYNATAPQPVTNSEFTQALARHLNRPAVLPAPAWLLKAVLGEMSELLLGSQRVLPQRLLEQGFEFHYPDLSSALLSSLKK
jgi:uncharacterized protein (TIGR01777 family)